MNDFDGVIDSLGAFGPFQRQVFLLVSAFETPTAWAMLLPLFTGASPEWWCEIDSVDLQTSNSNHSTNTTESHTYRVMKACNINGRDCDRIVFDDSFTSIVTQFGLVCELDYASNLITTLQMVGLLFGAALSGQLADMFGRKKILFANYLALLVLSLGSGFANTWELYAFLRVLVGASIGGMLVVNFILPIEYVGIQWRTFCGCVGFWAIGVMLLPLWAYFIRNWSYLCMATSLAGIPLLGTWRFIPESCRWLVTRGRYEEAEVILQQMSMRNNKPLPDPQLLRTFAKTDEEIKNQQRKFSYWHLCLTPKSALCTFVCMYAWFASSSVYYGVSYNWSNLAGDRYINVFLSGLVEIPALIFVLCVNNRIGRRWTVFILFLLAGLSLTSIMIINSLNKELSSLVLAMALIGKSAISGGWAAVQVFSAEKFPTLIRNIGIASCAFASRIGGVIAPQIVSLHAVSPQLPFVVFGTIALLCAVSSVFMSETAQLPLPDQVTSKITTSKREHDVEMSENISIHDSQITKPLTAKEISIDVNPPSPKP